MITKMIITLMMMMMMGMIVICVQSVDPWHLAPPAPTCLPGDLTPRCPDYNFSISDLRCNPTLFNHLVDVLNNDLFVLSVRNE